MSLSPGFKASFTFKNKLQNIGCTAKASVYKRFIVEVQENNYFILKIRLVHLVLATDSAALSFTSSTAIVVELPFSSISIISLFGIAPFHP